MSASQLLTLSLTPVMRFLRRFWLKRRLSAIGYHRAFIASQNENNRHAERLLQSEEALLRSELRGF